MTRAPGDNSNVIGCSRVTQCDERALNDVPVRVAARQGTTHGSNERVMLLPENKREREGRAGRKAHEALGIELFYEGVDRKGNHRRIGGKVRGVQAESGEHSKGLVRVN